MDIDVEGAAGEAPGSDLQRLRRVTDLAARLSAAHDVLAVAEAILSAAVLELDADRVAVMRLRDGAQRLEIIASRGLDPDLQRRYATIGVDEPLPASEALRTGELVVISSREDLERRYPVFRGATASPTMVQVPLRPHDGPPVGVISVGFLDGRPLDESALRFLEAVGHLCGIAMARAELAEASARALQRQSFLADAGAVLAGSLDPEQVVERVARLAVPALADACSICLADGDHLRPVAVAHADADQQAVVERLAARQPRITNPDLLRVFTDGVSMLESSVPPDDHPAAEDDEHQRLLGLLGVTGGLAVPLTAGSRHLGVLVLMMTSDARRLTEEDLAFAEDVAVRAALAIDNARLHHWRAEQMAGMRGALDGRASVEQAKGFLAATWGMPVDATFEPLRRHARRTRRPIHDVAEDLLTGQLTAEELTG